MSMHRIEQEIRRLLASTEPEVVCISGRWGVGKTYAWRSYFNDARAKGEIGLHRYAYVSLFGVNSLDDFKNSVFASTLDILSDEAEPGLKALWNNMTAAAKKWAKKARPALENAPITKNAVSVLAPYLFLSVSDTIVCVDDIERRGDKLTVKDVFGLVSHLKEQKRCKVILILNEEQINENDIKEFRVYFEKVIDVFLRFSPTAEESVGLVLPSATGTAKLLADRCVALGISNIRLIKKIEHYVRLVEPILAKYHDKVLLQAVQSLVLLNWSLYEPGLAPPIEYIQSFNAYMLEFNKNREVNEHEAAWNRKLISYNFTNMDDFDRVLLDGVRDGYFNAKPLEERAAELDKAFKNGESEGDFREAWELYHGSFESNQEEVLDAIAAAFKRNVHTIDPVNLNGTVTLFKELGRGEQAKDLISLYVASRGDSPKLFDMAIMPFADHVTDADVREAFEKKRCAVETKRHPKEILLEIGDKRRWSPEDMKVLTELSVDDFYTLFKENRRDEMQRMIWTALEFEKIGGLSEAERGIATLAREALKHIGKESEINARRVRRYGVRVEE